LIQAYINGDNQTFDKLYLVLKDELLLIAYYYTGEKEISKDIIHDVFEKLLQLSINKRKDYFGEKLSNFEGYLKVIVKNKCLDNIKIKKNRERIIHSIRPLFNKNSENKAHESFLEEGLSEMLKYLQPKEKEIIQLHLKGYSNDEIAIQLNITYNSVKNNVYESKKKIKNIWDLFMK
jgi:RNA polymerase sigma-70 factor (ECF subfamily)